MIMFYFMNTFFLIQSLTPDLWIPKGKIQLDGLRDSVQAIGFMTDFIEAGPGKSELDQRISSYFSYDSKHLYAAIEWSDNIWDVIRIPKDSVRWKSKRGRGDRMYFYDNIGIRIFWQNNYYELWLTVFENNNQFFQWNALEIEDSVKKINHQVNISNIVVKAVNPNHSLIEIEIPWEKLSLKGNSGFQFSIQIIATDSDEIGLDLVEKRKRIKYKHRKLNAELM